MPGQERVRYQERQLLRAADLQLEQAYRLAMQRRHLIAPHGWGIVTGLRIAGAADDPDQRVVAKGVAVDGYGRLLVLPEDYPLPPAVLAGDPKWLVWAPGARHAEAYDDYPNEYESLVLDGLSGVL